MGQLVLVWDVMLIVSSQLMDLVFARIHLVGLLVQQQELVLYVVAQATGLKLMDPVIPAQQEREFMPQHLCVVLAQMEKESLQLMENVQLVLATKPLKVMYV